MPRLLPLIHCGVVAFPHGALYQPTGYDLIGAVTTHLFPVRYFGGFYHSCTRCPGYIVLIGFGYTRPFITVTFTDLFTLRCYPMPRTVDLVEHIYGCYVYVDCPWRTLNVYGYALPLRLIWIYPVYS